MFSLLDAVFQLSSNSDAATDMVTVIIPDSSFAQVHEGLMNVYLHNNFSALLNHLGTNLLDSQVFSNNKINPKNTKKYSAEQAFISEDQSSFEESSMKITTDSNHHSLIMDPVSRKACEVCGMLVNKVKEHMLRKHPEYIENTKTFFQCSYCSYSTYIKSTFRQHILNKHTEKTLECKLCEYKTALHARLKQHIKRVHGSPKFTCSYIDCNRKFVQECDLNDHKKRKHPTGTYNCHICGKDFVNGDKLKTHIKLHNVDEDGIPCDSCHLKFLTKQKLREHQNTHTGETPYKCPGLGCKKAFMSSSSLSHHKKICSWFKNPL